MNKENIFLIIFLINNIIWIIFYLNLNKNKQIYKNKKIKEILEENNWYKMLYKQPYANTKIEFINKYGRYK